MSDTQATGGTAPEPITIDVVSDTICPWCYIGKRRLEQALALRPDVAVAVRWRPFLLDPTIPKGGVDRQEYLEKKFGGPERARQIYAQIEDAAKSEGLDVHFSRIVRTPNTIDSHRLLHWAAGTGKQSDVAESLFRRYFTEGRNIESPDELQSAAEENGISGEDLAAFLGGDEDRETVEQGIAHAQAIGVTGVPCFIFDGRFGVMGAQSPEALAQAIDRAVTERAQKAAQ